ncbi:mandelate racemase/muconate lactonizing enzyme family protein [Pseudooceanicola sp. C21-150M6]|uniref:mandelate racemase/muconate lactonizing enzyme family protein n=1 Tax=Pseudooceanicola sp. C21-150M6 TaxID=3434355 RepID=UPI003D7F39A2
MSTAQIMPGDFLRDSEIVSIDMIPLRCTPYGGAATGSAREMGGQRGTTLLRLKTRGGVEGLGECFGMPAASMAYLDLIREAYIGRPLTDHPAIWRYMVNKFYHVRGSSQLAAAVSGVDIALHDAWAKMLGMPLYRMLGGEARTSVTLYASGGLFNEEGAPDLRAQLERVAGSFIGYKIKIGRDPREDAERARLARSIIGPDARLMIDMNGSYSADDALWSLQHLQDCDPWWVEEPVAPENLDGYRRLAQTCRLRIASGEVAIMGHEFKALAETGGVDVLMPDLNLCGGFLEGRIIADYAQLSGLNLSPHVWGGAIAQIAAAHFTASLPRHPHYACSDMMVEYDITRNPLRDDILTEPLTISDGCLMMPEGPGLGVDIDPDALKHLIAE